MKKYFLVVLILLVPVIGFTETCKELATSFSNDPDAMTLDRLTQFESCIMERIHEKMIKDGVMPGIQSPDEIPPPPDDWEIKPQDEKFKKPQ